MISKSGAANATARQDYQTLLDLVSRAEGLIEDGTVDRWRTRYRGADARVLDALV